MNDFLGCLILSICCNTPALILIYFWKNYLYVELFIDKLTFLVINLLGTNF